MPDETLSPPSVPGPAELEEATRKGLGRALLWARRGLYTSPEILLAACLHDQRFEPMVEDERVEWLWEIARTAGCTHILADPMLAALENLQPDHNRYHAHQLCEFGRLLARDGDRRFHQQLLKIMHDRPVNEQPWLGEDQLVELDGPESFRLTVAVRGRDLMHREWTWYDDSLCQWAKEKLGRTDFHQLLKEEAAKSPDAARFLAGFREASRTKPLKLPDTPAPPPRDTLMDIIQLVENTEARWEYQRSYKWVRRATGAELAQLTDRLFIANDPEAQRRYLTLLGIQPAVAFDERLLELLDHSDPAVRSEACVSLRHFAHPAIRAAALRHVHTTTPPVEVLNLFIKNFEAGDDAMLARTLPVPEEPERQHSFQRLVRQISNENATVPCPELSLRGYRVTPCSHCRTSAVQCVLEDDPPAWFLLECKADVAEATRAEVADWVVEPRLVR